MKKLLVLFVAVAATISLSAKTVYYFNRAQFQWSSPAVESELKSIMPQAATLPNGENGNYTGTEDFDIQVTVPFVYQGTIAMKADWIYEPAPRTLYLNGRRAAQCLINTKATYPAVMTMCQPCIDCYPCETLNSDDHDLDGLSHEGIWGGVADYWKDDADYAIIDYKNVWGNPGFITIWNLYVITNVDKKAKEVTFLKINLIKDNDAATVARFFTGAQKGAAYAKQQVLDATTGGQVNLQLSGTKSDYTFKYYTKYLSKSGGVYHWAALTNNLGKENTAYIKAPKALNGTIYYNYVNMPGEAVDPLTACSAAQLQVVDAAGTVKLTRNASLTKEAIKSTFAVTVKKSTIKNWDDCQEAAPESSTCEEYLMEGGAFENSYFGKKYKNYEWLQYDYAATELFGILYDASEQKAFEKFFEAGEEESGE